MKKLILCVAASAFALASSVQADNSTKAPADKNATCSEGSKSCCGGKSACTKSMPSKTVLMSPKAAAAAGKS
ncbi:MAG: hypothetical protein JWQ04_1888 [Pedosphaera sp.]|nr:hypothetical protein [Pedosphaera sp.]